MVVSEIWWVKYWLIGVCLRQGWTWSHPHRWSACEGQIVWFLESSFCVCRASHLALTFHSCLFSSRASLANCRLNLALVYFEKAVDNVIANKGDSTSELVSLYQEIAQIEQLRRNHEQAIQHVISSCTVMWSVHDTQRDQCMLSHVINAWWATWSVHDSHVNSAWTEKNWCFWTVVLEKTLESP